MNGDPLISCIIIFWNAEKYIEEAIQSVFAQTYTAWELLLCDDGSVDGSTGIARRYAERYPDKVRYLDHPNHQNRGMSATRNLGIHNAAGEYLAFLDADDVWLPDKLERQLLLLESQPEAAMVYGPTQWWYSWTGNPEDRHRDYIHEIGVPTNSLLQPPTVLTRFIRTEGISPCTCSVLLRRKAVERIGGFEELFEGLYEDQAFFAKMCLSAPVYVSTECLARYRQHPESNTILAGQTGDYTLRRRIFLDWLAVYLSRQGIQDVAVWKALRRELRFNRHPILQKLILRPIQAFLGRLLRFGSRLRTRWLRLPLIRQLRSTQFRRLQPIGNGRLRGTPIVRYYWDRYLQKNRSAIRGVALEIGTTYTIRSYGGQSVDQADAIDLFAHSPEVTVVADLSRADDIAADIYDCFVIQFTMHLIYDVEAALFHAVRILKPGGVLLVNFPCVDYYFPHGLDMGTGEPLYMYWWFTPIQVENILRRIGLHEADYSLEIYGNLFTRVAYQLNLPAEELTEKELDTYDAGHPLLICARVVKPANWQVDKPVYRDAWRPGIMPSRWNPETGHYSPREE